MIDSKLPPEILYLSICFPYVALDGLLDLDDFQFENWLPTREVAWRLVEYYFIRVAALYVPPDR